MLLVREEMDTTGYIEENLLPRPQKDHHVREHTAFFHIFLSYLQ